jgi:histidinol-phosphatase (PHP family)
MIDYHIHTNFSDGKNSYKDYIEKAKSLNLREIGFSDHVCLNFPRWSMKLKDIDIANKEIINLKKENDLKIKYGFECDYLPEKEKEIEIILKKYPVDYVIGSVHYINNWNFDTDKQKFKEIDINQFYINYFNLIKKAAKSGLFDIIGHIDLAKKFNYFPSFSLHTIYIDVAKCLKEYDLTFELNTSGMDKECKEFYPSDEFLQILCDYKIPVTLGSDSHKAENLNRYFNLAIEKLKNIGFNQLALFDKRKRSFIKMI